MKLCGFMRAVAVAAATATPALLLSACDDDTEVVQAGGDGGEVGDAGPQEIERDGELPQGLRVIKDDQPARCTIVGTKQIVRPTVDHPEGEVVATVEIFDQFPCCDSYTDCLDARRMGEDAGSFCELDPRLTELLERPTFTCVDCYVEHANGWTIGCEGGDVCEERYEPLATTPTDDSDDQQLQELLVPERLVNTCVPPEE